MRAQAVAESRHSAGRTPKKKWKNVFAAISMVTMQPNPADCNDTVSVLSVDLMVLFGMCAWWQET